MIINHNKPILINLNPSILKQKLSRIRPPLPTKNNLLKFHFPSTFNVHHNPTTPLLILYCVEFGPHNNLQTLLFQYLLQFLCCLSIYPWHDLGMFFNDSNFGSQSLENTRYFQSVLGGLNYTKR